MKQTVEDKLLIESATRYPSHLMGVRECTMLRKAFEAGAEWQAKQSPWISVIQLKPIIDWTDNDVWDYIHKHNLPVNPEYEHSKRVGCIVCPKANFTGNYIGLMKYPKLIDAFILAREKAERNDAPISWLITGENKECTNDKPYYICRWLNHSFMPFTPKQEELYRQVRGKYNKIHSP